MNTPVTPMFPLGSVLLPGERLPLRVFEPRYVAMLEDVLDGDRTFGVVLIERGSEVGGGDVRADAGTLARVEKWAEAGHRRYSLLCRGVEPIVVDEWLADDPYPRAIVHARPDEPSETPDWETLDGRRAQLQLLCGQAGRGMFGMPDPQLRAVASRLSEPVDYAAGDPTASSFHAVADLPLGEADRQAALVAESPAARVDVLIAALDDLIAALRFRLQA